MNEFEALTCSVKAKKLNKLERRRRGDLTESRTYCINKTKQWKSGKRTVRTAVTTQHMTNTTLHWHDFHMECLQYFQYNFSSLPKIKKSYDEYIFAMPKR